MSDQEEQSKFDKILGYSELNTLEFYMSALNELFFTMLFLFLTSSVLIPEIGITNLLQVACGFGFVLAVIHLQASKIYDCHLNPALTFGLVCWGRTPIIRGSVYMIMQTAGGIMGFVKLMKVQERFEGICCEPIDVKPWVAILLEVITTHLFVFVAAYVAREERRKQQEIFSSFFYGLTYAAGYLVTLPVTAGGINPARCIGPAVWFGFWQYHWVFWAAQLLGGLIGVGFCKAFDKGV